MFNAHGKNKLVVILGDTNADITNKSQINQTNLFYDEFKAFRFLLMINIPTRIAEESCTCIDHIYVYKISPASTEC